MGLFLTLVLSLFLLDIAFLLNSRIVLGQGCCESRVEVSMFHSMLAVEVLIIEFGATHVRCWSCIWHVGRLSLPLACQRGHCGGGDWL